MAFICVPARLKPPQAGARFELLELVLQTGLRLGFGIVVEIRATIGTETLAVGRLGQIFAIHRGGARRHPRRELASAE